MLSKVETSMRFKKYLTKNPSETKKLGKSLAQKILKNSPKKGAFALGLEGDLGGGKTTFLQGFARGLGIKQKILSPTFIIMRKFKIPLAVRARQNSKSKFKNFYHIDCYRIKKPREILNLGFKEIIADPQNVVAIEWANRIRKILPQGRFLISFELVDKNTRKIKIWKRKKSV